MAFYHLDSIHFSDPDYQVLDVSGNNNTGIARGGIFPAEGIQGNALGFDGVDDYVEFSASPSFNINASELTLSIWTKLPARPTELSSAYAPLFDSETDNYVLYGDRGSSELRFKVSTSGGAERPGIPDADIPVNEWIHVVGVYDGTSAMIYLNGELKDSHALSGTVKSGQVATLGKTGSVYLEGFIDQVEVYSRALTQEEITGIFEYYTGEAEVVCPEITITTSDGVAASKTAGDSFQWLDCDNGHTVISGETDSIYSPGNSGNFAVVVSNGECVDTSECVFVQATGNDERSTFNHRIYPNPSQGTFTLDLKGASGRDWMVQVINADGKSVFEKTIPGGREHRIDLSAEPSGIFLLRAVSGKEEITHPIVIL